MSTETTQPDLKDLNVIVSGQGGDGSLTVVTLLANVLRQNGMSVYTERDVLSRIKGGITAAILAQKGVTGAINSLEGIHGYYKVYHKENGYKIQHHPHSQRKEEQKEKTCNESQDGGSVWQWLLRILLRSGTENLQDHVLQMLPTHPEGE